MFELDGEIPTQGGQPTLISIAQNEFPSIRKTYQCLFIGNSSILYAKVYNLSRIKYIYVCFYLNDMPSMFVFYVDHM